MLYNVYMHVIPGPDTSDKVIHNIYPDGLPVNPDMLNPNIGGYKKCRHIYEYVGSDICPDCGRDTHEVDFQLHYRLFREYYASDAPKAYRCPVEGGIIRGWWDI